MKRGFWKGGAGGASPPECRPRVPRRGENRRAPRRRNCRAAARLRGGFAHIVEFAKQFRRRRVCGGSELDEHFRRAETRRREAELPAPPA